MTNVVIVALAGFLIGLGTAGIIWSVSQLRAQKRRANRVRHTKRYLAYKKTLDTPKI